MKLKFVCHPSVSRLSLFLMGEFKMLVVASPGPYARNFFFFFFEFKRKKKIFVNIVINIGPYGSQNVKTLLLPQIEPESFETSPEFSS